VGMGMYHLSTKFAQPSINTDQFHTKFAQDHCGALANEFWGYGWPAARVRNKNAAAAMPRPIANVIRHCAAII
jgi:hypothetical protein